MFANFDDFLALVVNGLSHVILVPLGIAIALEKVELDIT